MSVDRSILMVNMSPNGEQIVQVGSIMMGKEQLHAINTAIQARLIYIILKDRLQDGYEETSPLASEPDKITKALLRVDRTDQNKLRLSSGRNEIVMDDNDLPAIIDCILWGVWKGLVQDASVISAKINEGKKYSGWDENRNQI